MKWFRHQSGLSGSDFVRKLEAEYGLNGYARFLKVLELVAGRMDESDACELGLSWADWEQALSGKRRLLAEWFDFCHQQGAFIVEADEKQLKTKCPQLLKLRDNHTKNLQAAGKKKASPPNELFSDTEQWAAWFMRELSYPEKRAWKADNVKLYRRWVASNVTTDEVCQAVERAIAEGVGVDTDTLHQYLTQIRRKKLEDANR